MIALESELGCHVASFSASTCVYKVMGAPSVLGEYYPDLRDKRFETIGCFGHNRYSTNTWPSFRRVQPLAMFYAVYWFSCVLSSRWSGRRWPRSSRGYPISPPA